MDLLPITLQKIARNRTDIEWKLFKPGYWVSDHGDVFSESSEKILKPTISRGYRCVSIGHPYCTSRVVKIAILVCHVFYGPKPFEKAMARHLDDVKTNDTKANLAWGSKHQNQQDAIANGRHNIGNFMRENGHLVAGERAGNAKLTWEKVRRIRALSGDGIAGKDLAGQFEVSPMTISDIINGRKWIEPGIVSKGKRISAKRKRK